MVGQILACAPQTLTLGVQGASALVQDYQASMKVETCPSAHDAAHVVVAAFQLELHAVRLGLELGLEQGQQHCGYYE